MGSVEGGSVGHTTEAKSYHSLCKELEQNPGWGTRLGRGFQIQLSALRGGRKRLKSLKRGTMQLPQLWAKRDITDKWMNSNKCYHDKDGESVRGLRGGEGSS